MMRTETRNSTVVLMLAAALLGGNVPFALAVDGVVLVDQNRALAGNVTPGDAPGFPVTISRTGSYRLSGNLTVPDENTTAIQITADGVTLDLNGFSILGPTVCSGSPVTSCTPLGSGIGIQQVGLSNNATVVNGIVRGMGGMGVDLNGDCRVEKVHAVSNGNDGIFVGASCTVSGNTVNENGSRGFFVFFGGVVSGNTARDNRNEGFRVSEASTVIGNVALRNGGAGLFLSAETGYTHNVLAGNSDGAVLGSGRSLGQNLCDGVIC